MQVNYTNSSDGVLLSAVVVTMDLDNFTIENITVSDKVPSLYNITEEDSNWIMTSAFIIFTMQTGSFYNTVSILNHNCIAYQYRNV